MNWRLEDVLFLRMKPFWEEVQITITNNKLLPHGTTHEMCRLMVQSLQFARSIASPVISGPLIDTQCKKGRHFNILLSAFKLTLPTSFLSSKIKRIFYLERVYYKNTRKTERRFGGILAPLSSKECNRKDNLYKK